MYFETEFAEFAHYKLLEIDWEVMEGLETVLMVSRLLDLGQALIVTTDSSYFSAKYVGRVDAGLIARDCTFRDAYDRMGEPWETTQHSQALDGYRFGVGHKILHSNG